MPQWTWVFWSTSKYEGFHDNLVGKESAYEIQETPLRFLGWAIDWRRDRLPTPVFLGLPAQLVNSQPAMREARVQPLGWEDPLEKATHSSILAWRIPSRCKELDMTERLSLSLSKHDPGFLVSWWPQQYIGSRIFDRSILRSLEFLGGAWIPHIIVNSFSAEEPLLCAPKTHSPHMACSWHCLLHACFPSYSWSDEKVRAICIFRNAGNYHN